MLKTLMEGKLLWAMNENPRKRSVLVVTVTGAWRWRSVLRRRHWSGCEPLRTEVGCVWKTCSEASLAVFSLSGVRREPSIEPDLLCWIMNGSSLWGWSQGESVLRTSPTFTCTKPAVLVLVATRSVAETQKKNPHVWMLRARWTIWMSLAPGSISQQFRLIYDCQSHLNTG